MFLTSVFSTFECNKTKYHVIIQKALQLSLLNEKFKNHDVKVEIFLLNQILYWFIPTSNITFTSTFWIIQKIFDLNNEYSYLL